MSVIYSGWGFAGNPFSPMPLLGDEIGNRLLIGRDKELSSVVFRLKAGGEAVSLDGPVGVGKTSLANVSAYRCEMDYISNPNSSPLLIPCRKPFQISADSTPEDFRFQVLTEVAQTLIEKGGKLNGASSSKLDTWLNSPLFRQVEGQVMGFGAGTSITLNDTRGFVDSGLFRLITKWLEDLFPDRSVGGVVCVIDNLELLETSDTARKTIEALRDTLFTLNGIRWVLCGAHGIVQGVVESPRLTGYLGQPVKVSKLKLQEAQAVFNARVSVFAKSEGEATYLPITADSFHSLYMILGQSLRQALATTHDYCLSIAESGSFPGDDDAKKMRFSQWLKAKAIATRKSIETHVGKKAMDLLAIAASNHGGEFTPSDFTSLGFNSVQALRSQVKSLEDVGVVESSRDESDQRRRSIMVTGKGWLVHWANITA